MLDMIVNVVAVLGVVMALLWLAYALIKRFWPSAATTDAGQVLGNVVDTTQAWAAYCALKMVRELDSVEADPKAIEACDYLLPLVTGWKRPAEKQSDDLPPELPADGSVDMYTVDPQTGQRVPVDIQ